MTSHSGNYAIEVVAVRIALAQIERRFDVFDTRFSTMQKLAKVSKSSVAKFFAQLT